VNINKFNVRTFVVPELGFQGEQIKIPEKVVKWYNISVNCNWVDTRWQYSTHLHTNNTQNKTINNKNNTTNNLTGKSGGRARSLRVIPWHLPYNWGKSTKNPVRIVEECHLVQRKRTIQNRICTLLNTPSGIVEAMTAQPASDLESSLHERKTGFRLLGTAVYLFWLKE
jgi:hypothetical protein